jgi:hypothetical protein
MYKELIETFEKKIKVNGKTHDVTVSIYVAEDYESVEGDFDFDDPKENAAYLARFYSGELSSVGIVVEAKVGFDAPKGEDSLWACHIRTGNTKDALQIVKDHGMVKIAVDELKGSLETLSKALGV